MRRALLLLALLASALDQTQLVALYSGILEALKPGQ